MPSVITPCGGSTNELHGVVIETVTVQSIPNDTYTALTFPSGIVDVDTDGYYNAGAFPSRFTVPAGLTGWYLCVGQIHWLANATGWREARWVLGSTGLEQGNIRVPTITTFGVDPYTPATALFLVAAGDYVSLQGRQASGGALNAVSSSASVMRLGVTA